MKPNILLVVTGSIAAYKAPDIVRRLQDLGAEVKVCLTKNALNFITEMSLEVVSGKSVVLPSADLTNSKINHIELARSADIILIAPASAHFIATIASGKADSLASSLVLARNCPLFIAPAMNVQMLNNAITKQNINKLENIGSVVIKASYGKQACGEVGVGRLASSEDIARIVMTGLLAKHLEHKRILITAGSTREPIDPVRFLSNRGSGKMALALIKSCLAQSAQVVCVYGQLQVELPTNIVAIYTPTASEMYQAVMREVANCDVFISVAAIADYRVSKPSKKKIKKTASALTLKLTPNVDILQSVCALQNPPFSVGFAAETENITTNAYKKYSQKDCDMLVVNDVSRSDIGLENDFNEVIIFDGENTSKIKRQFKQKIADKIIAIIANKITKI